MTTSILDTGNPVLNNVLRQVVADGTKRYGVKLFARRLGRSHRTVEDWAQGRNQPSKPADLVALMAESDELIAAVNCMIRERREICGR